MQTLYSVNNQHQNNNGAYLHSLVPDGETGDVTEVTPPPAAALKPRAVSLTEGRTVNVKESKRVKMLISECTGCETTQMLKKCWNFDVDSMLNGIEKSTVPAW